MKKLTLLYAEDEQLTRKDHITYLKSRYDFSVYEANNGLEALSLYKTHKPDIVLTDISMPHMSGLELAKEIRKISKHTKIIILTAYSEQDKLMQALESSVVNYLIKPIDRKKLVTSIDMAIETMPEFFFKSDNHIMLGDNIKFDLEKSIYYVGDEALHLSKSETKLLELLSEYPNSDISSYDIFVHVWDDFEKEFSSDSVRALVKKLRKKLPDGILRNIYGGFYRLETKA